MEISVSFHFPVWFLTDFFVFFYERVLLRLRNSRSEFCVAVLTQCGAILKLGGNTTISFLCAFFYQISLISFYEHVLFSLQICQNPQPNLWKPIPASAGMGPSM